MRGCRVLGANSHVGKELGVCRGDLSCELISEELGIYCTNCGRPVDGLAAVVYDPFVCVWEDVPIVLRCHAGDVVRGEVMAEVVVSAS